MMTICIAGWIFYECVSPDGVSPSVTCKYTDYENNIIDVTAVDFWCCETNVQGSNITTVKCPLYDECFGWEDEVTRVKVNLDHDLVASTYAPPITEGPPVKEKKGYQLRYNMKL